MLVLSRKVGEKILIGDDISITVVRLSGGGVRIGIDAPPELAVVREELAQNRAKAPETKPKNGTVQSPVGSDGSGSIQAGRDSGVENPKKPR